MADWRGLTMQSNFTYGKALGTGSIVQATSQWTVPDAYNLRSAYGLQSWDRKFLYNLFFVYQPRWYKSQHGVVGRIVGGWSIAPILNMGSGLPNEVIPTDGNILGTYQGGGGQAFGQSDGSSSGFSSFENAINMCGSGVGGNSRHNNPTPSANYPGMGSAFFGPGMFQNPEAVYNCFRNPILGIDKSDGGGAGILRGQMYWNVDPGRAKGPHDHGARPFAIRRQLHQRLQSSVLERSLQSPWGYSGLGCAGQSHRRSDHRSCAGERSADDTAWPAGQLLTTSGEKEKARCKKGAGRNGLPLFSLATIEQAEAQISLLAAGFMATFANFLTSASLTRYVRVHQEAFHLKT